MPPNFCAPVHPVVTTPPVEKHTMRPFTSFWQRLGGIRWRFRFVRSSEIPNDRWADCSDPSDPKRQIRVRQVLRGLPKLETIIHEALHAQWPDATEETVARHGRELSRLLWRCGYRQVDGP